MSHNEWLVQYYTIFYYTLHAATIHFICGIYVVTMWQIYDHLEYRFHMTPIWVNQSDKFHMVAICQCYWGTVVSCTVFELFVSFARYSDLSVENATFFMSHLHLAPTHGATLLEFRQYV